MNNFYYALKGVWKCAAAPLLFFLFFLMSAENASAQSFVTVQVAGERLKIESNLLYERLLLETPGSTNYNLIASRIHYFGTITTLLGQGLEVAQSIHEAIPGICYPSNNADCNQLDKARMEVIVEETTILLSN